MLPFNEVPHAPVRDTTTIRPPAASHGADMWRVARDSDELDLNSSYKYMLFARDFARTCRVAVVGDRVVAFVLGYRRPEAPERLFVWQIAVDEDHRGAGLAGRLLDDLVTVGDTESPVVFVETTITDDNTASQRLFAAFAERRSAPNEVSDLFDGPDFPDRHDAERLHRIGPIPSPVRG